MFDTDKLLLLFLKVNDIKPEVNLKMFLVAKFRSVVVLLNANAKITLQSLVGTRDQSSTASFFTLSNI